MNTIRLAVALLLLTAMTGVAAADDKIQTGNPLAEPQTKKVRKIYVILNSIGVNSPEVKQFIESVDARVDNGYLMLREERVANGTLTLHYELSGGLRAKQIELRFTPDDSNWQATARPDAVMVNYKLKF